MNEDQLITALKGQDPGAAQELVNAYGDRLLRSAFALCGNEADAQDIVQDTFLQAIRSVHRFRGRSTVYTWLHAILFFSGARVHETVRSDGRDIQSTVSIEVSYLVPTYKFSKEGNLVVDTLSYETVVASGTLWTGGPERVRQK